MIPRLFSYHDRNIHVIYDQRTTRKVSKIIKCIFIYIYKSNIQLQLKFKSSVFIWNTVRSYFIAKKPTDSMKIENNMDTRSVVDQLIKMINGIGKKVTCIIFLLSTYLLSSMTRKTLKLKIKRKRKKERHNLEMNRKIHG